MRTLEKLAEVGRGGAAQFEMEGAKRVGWIGGGGGEGGGAKNGVCVWVCGLGGGVGGIGGVGKIGRVGRQCG